MRIAVCFSGLPRLRAVPALASWHRLCREWHADVFAHAWISDDAEGVLARVAGEFAPKLLRIEPPRALDVAGYTQRIWPTANAYRMLSGFTSIHLAHDLALAWSNHHRFSYDIMVRARWDVEVDAFTPEPVAGVAVHDDPDKLGLRFTYRGEQLWGINDLLAYGSPEAMASYSRTDELMHSLYHDEGVDVCPEIFLTASLKRQGTPIVFKPLPHRIVRWS